MYCIGILPENVSMILSEHNYYKLKYKIPNNLDNNKPIPKPNESTENNFNSRIDNDEDEIKHFLSTDITVKEEKVDFSLPISNSNTNVVSPCKRNLQNSFRAVIKSEPDDYNKYKASSDTYTSRKTTAVSDKSVLKNTNKNINGSYVPRIEFVNCSSIDNGLKEFDEEHYATHNYPKISLEKKRILRFIEKFCNYCNEKIPTRYKRKDSIHCKKCSNKISMYCSKCNKECDSESFLENHLNQCYKLVVENNVHYEICLSCNKKFTEQTSFVGHIQWCGKNFFYYCDHCPFQTMFKANLKVHLERHSVENFTSHTENIVDIDNVPLVDKNTGKVLIRKTGCFLKFFKRYCPHCNESVMNSAYYGKKICLKCKKVMMLQCKKCNKTLDSYSQMIYHIKHTCSPKQQKCLKCGRCYKSYYRMEQHIKFKCKFRKRKLRCKTGDNEKPICGNCGKIFKNNRRLWQHSKICSSRLFCEHCDFSTDDKSKLIKHVKQYPDCTGIKRYNALKEKNQLDKTFLRCCLVCNKSRPDKTFSDFLRCQKCKKIMLFQCQNCGEKFSDHSEFKSHQRKNCQSTNIDLKNKNLETKHIKSSTATNSNNSTLNDQNFFIKFHNENPTPLLDALKQIQEAKGNFKKYSVHVFYETIPDVSQDQAKSIYESLLTHRDLVFDRLNLQTLPSNGLFLNRKDGGEFRGTVKELRKLMTASESSHRPSSLVEASTIFAQSIKNIAVGERSPLCSKNFDPREFELTSYLPTTPQHVQGSDNAGLDHKANLSTCCLAGQDSFSELHLHDGYVDSCNLMVWGVSGAYKLWLVVHRLFNYKLNQVMRSLSQNRYKAGVSLEGLAGDCNTLHHHKKIMVTPSFLEQNDIPYSIIIQPPRALVYIADYVYHQAISCGVSLSESVSIGRRRRNAPFSWFGRCKCLENMDEKNVNSKPTSPDKSAATDNLIQRVNIKSAKNEALCVLCGSMVTKENILKHELTCISGHQKC